ncbi:hypothetical protein [Brucella anthropi]|uniref:hypothetical protein n=1 Tax=Brucella anthropi TaxID=529 RepID=UPI00384FE158
MTDISRAADAMVLLLSFSIRSGFVSKAIIYARASMTLFPDEMRLRELCCYAHMLDGDLDRTSELLDGYSHETHNLAFARLSVDIQKAVSEADKIASLQAYLFYGKSP